MALAALPIAQNLSLSKSNASTATLLAAAVYTGTAETLLNFAGVQLNIFSDVASATNGVSFQQSNNGTNWDIVNLFTVKAGVGLAVTVPTTLKFYRVVYTNGGTNQTVFRLQCVLVPIPVIPAVLRPATAVLANVAGSATTVVLQAANGSRLGWTCYNDSTKDLMIAFAATASATAFTVLVPKIASGVGGYYELPFAYTGVISGIWTGTNGAARVTELS